MSLTIEQTPAVAFPAATTDVGFKSFKTMLFPRPFDKLQIPASTFVARIHPLTDEVADEVNQFYLDNWPFPGEKERKKFLAADFARFACYHFPNSRDDRLRLACEVLIHLILVDDILEDMAIKDGQAFSDRLRAILRGEVLPDRSSPPEWIMHEVWERLRKCDRELADAMIQPCFDFLNAVTDPRRLTKMCLEEYLEYRQKDVGKQVLSTLICFTQGLQLTQEEMALLDPVDKNAGRHMSVTNDIWSYDKEAKAIPSSPQAGPMVNCVDVLAGEGFMPIASAKRVLYQPCREWESVHETLVAEIVAKRDSPALRAYLKANEYQISGNEAWCRWTLRYQQSG